MSYFCSHYLNMSTDKNKINVAMKEFITSSPGLQAISILNEAIKGLQTFVNDKILT